MPRLIDYISRYPYTDLSALNMDYWIKLVGEAAADIKALNEDNAAIRQEMADFEQEVRDYLDSQDIPGQVRTEVDNYLDNWFDTISDPVFISKDNWSNRKILFMGDSWGNGWDGSQTTTSPFTTCANALGASYVDISHGGCRFGAGDASYLYLTYIQNYVTLHADQCASFTDVIICGGANDITHNPDENLDDASNPGSIRNTISYIKSNFPNARIFIGMYARMGNTGASGATLANTDKVRNSYRAGAIAHGAIYLSGSEYMMHDYRLFASDGIHLTSYYDLGIKLAELLAHGDFTRWYTSPTTVNFTAVGSDSGSQLIPTNVSFGGQRYRGHSIMLDLNDVEFNRYDTPISSIGWGSIYKFATISGSTSTRNSFCASTQSFRQRVTAAVEYTGTDNETHKENLPGSIYLYDNALYFSIEGFVPAGTSDIHIPNVEYIRFKGGCQFFLDEAFC